MAGIVTASAVAFAKINREVEALSAAALYNDAVMRKEKLKKYVKKEYEATMEALNFYRDHYLNNRTVGSEGKIRRRHRKRLENAMEVASSKVGKAKSKNSKMMVKEKVVKIFREKAEKEVKEFVYANHGKIPDGVIIPHLSGIKTAKMIEYWAGMTGKWEFGKSIRSDPEIKASVEVIRMLSLLVNGIVLAEDAGAEAAGGENAGGSGGGGEVDGGSGSGGEVAGGSGGHRSDGRRSGGGGEVAGGSGGRRSGGRRSGGGGEVAGGSGGRRSGGRKSSGGYEVSGGSGGGGEVAGGSGGGGEVAGGSGGHRSGGRKSGGRRSSGGGATDEAT